MNYEFLLGNNLETLKTLADNSVDSVITDPPYGLSFMNKKWDYDVPSIDLWKEVYRVLKPGGHLLSFGGTRTYHRMVVNIEDAGFEIRDQIMWLYGSGFPKSLNIGKAIDKMEGNEREVLGDNPYNKLRGESSSNHTIIAPQNPSIIDKGYSKGEGWGTGLKPANEPIVVARKPISENTIAENFIKWGVGGINIDECRVGSETIKSNSYYNLENEVTFKMGRIKSKDDYEGGTHEGRFPANLILECTCDEVIKGENGEIKKSEFKYIDTSELYGKFNNIRTTTYTDKGDIHTNPECPCRLLDDQSGNSKSPKKVIRGGKTFHGQNYNINNECQGYSDSGGASRFFYVAKTSKEEQNMNNIHTNPECPCRLLDEQSGFLKSGDGKKGINKINRNGETDGVCKMDMGKSNEAIHYGDSGGASRFFYVAKTSKAERNMGLDNFEDKVSVFPGLNSFDNEGNRLRTDGSIIPPLVSKNNHPTVKPVNLMYYLCKLVTPKGGVILDPYMGSGSTGIAALLGEYTFIGCEMEVDYFEIARTRIINYEKYRKFLKK